MNPPEDVRLRVGRILGATPRVWKATSGGYTPAGRWVAEFADGRTVFVKVGMSTHTSEWLRREGHWYSRLRGDFLPEVHAFEDDEDHPILILEDLSSGRWPPPWEASDVERVLDTLARIGGTRSLPDDLPLLESYRPGLSSWTMVERDAEPFLRLGLCSEGWLSEALPVLLDAQTTAELAGNDLIHFDVRSDNICLLPDRVVLVDWSDPVKGRREFDVALWAPSLRLEGGPLPEELLPGRGDLAAVVSGFFAARAGLADIPDAPLVRRIQLRQLRIALPWACRELGLPQPDVLYAGEEIPRIDRAFETGEIAEDEWHARVEEVLIDAYLSTDDPRGGSGKSGDESEWKWARELILDVFPKKATFLDVGCANGYLMESVHRWGAERGLEVEPYGLDISWRIASLARFRLPHWSDRIFVGNAVDWVSPRRFDVVQIGIDEVPPPRRGELIDRVLREFVVPGGKLVFRAGRAGGDDPQHQLEALGLKWDGDIESTHPHTGEVRRTAWIQAPVG